MTKEELRVYLDSIAPSRYSMEFRDIDTFVDSRGITRVRAFVSDRHTVRGASGGNCWGGEATSYDVGELPLDSLPFPSVEDFITEHFPDLPYLKYKELRKGAVDAYVYDREYYGNFTQYQYGLIPFEHVIAVLGTD